MHSDFKQRNSTMQRNDGLESPTLIYKSNFRETLIILYTVYSTVYTVSTDGRLDLTSINLFFNPF